MVPSIVIGTITMTTHRKLHSRLAQRVQAVAANLPSGLSISPQGLHDILAKCPIDRERRFWRLLKRELDHRGLGEETIFTLADAVEPNGAETVREIARML